MAQKKSTPRKSTGSKKAARRSKPGHFPVINSAYIDEQTAGTTLSKLLEVDKALSRLNKRMYRQGRYYQTKIDLDPTSTETFSVFALVDSWPVQKAFQMAYKQYLNNTSEERKRLGDNMVGRWEDFRVSPGIAGPHDFLVPTLYAGGAAAAKIIGGEFNFANVVDETGTRYGFSWGPGTPGATYGLLDEYNKAAITQDSPNTPSATGPYDNLQPGDSSLTYFDLQNDGNAPPYVPNTVHQVTPWVKIAQLGASATGVQKLSTGFFNAPCGLVWIQATSNDASVTDLSFTVKLGDYKGVHARSMLE